MEFAELGDFGGVGVPEVDAVAEAHCQLVGGAPVDEVQVEIVLEGGSVEHLARHLVDLPHSPVLAVFAEMEGVMHFALLPELRSAAVSQNVGVSEGQQLFLAGPASAAEYLLGVDFSDGYVLGVDFWLVLLVVVVLLALVVAGGSFAIGYEAVVEGG